jgi:hypothetical protein
MTLSFARLVTETRNRAPARGSAKRFKRKCLAADRIEAAGNTPGELARAVLSNKSANCASRPRRIRISGLHSSFKESNETLERKKMKMRWI